MKDINPKRGEIWLVEFQPKVGSEIEKTRPAVIINIPGIVSSTRIIVPIREQKEHHKKVSFYVPLEPGNYNGLKKKSTIDCLQIKSFDLHRFQKRLGKITTDQLEEITKLIAIEVGYI
ncbi:MAG: type II toxin-antitoxin system PemK/MazF family toxin [Candidatus Gracilibacteria bacterium]